MAKRSVRDRLLDTLEDLGEDELKKFKGKLNEFPLKEGYDNIPKGKLQKADALDLCDLLLGYYTEGYALEVTAAVLEVINCKPQARRVRDLTGIGGCNAVQPQVPPTSANAGRTGTQPPVPLELHFIDRHREALIRRTATVEGVLDQLHGTILDEEQYERISSKSTNQEKMRELYRLVPSWNLYCKNQLYEALKLKNKFLIDDLEGQ